MRRPPFPPAREQPITLQAWDAFPSCPASSRIPTFVLMIFCWFAALCSSSKSISVFSTSVRFYLDYHAAKRQKRRQARQTRSSFDLLKPFNVAKAHADRNPAYASRIPAEELEAGKLGRQRIERLHLSLRAWCSRLARKGIRFSKRRDMHEIVVALVINFWFFCRVLV